MPDKYRASPQEVASRNLPQQKVDYTDPEWDRRSQGMNRPNREHPIKDTTPKITDKSWENAGFVKHDEGKRRHDLVPYDALDEIIKALEFGANKYSDDNWLKGTLWSKYWNPAMRHLVSWWIGESRDPESGLTHLAHAGACILFLITYEKRLLGEDDRVTPTGE